MKKIGLMVVALVLACALQARAQEKIPMIVLDDGDPNPVVSNFYAEVKTTLANDAFRLTNTCDRPLCLVLSMLAMTVDVGGQVKGIVVAFSLTTVTQEKWKLVRDGAPVLNGGLALRTVSLDHFKNGAQFILDTITKMLQYMAETAQAIGSITNIR